MARRRNREDVVQAAFELLEEGGLEAVTLNAIARKLEAHLNSVSFQVKTKSRLLNMMANELLGSLSLEELPDDPRDRVTALMNRYRRVLLGHRDGARLVAGTEAAEHNTLRVADVGIGALLAAGASPEQAVCTFWSLHYFLLGLVQEEQSEETQNTTLRLQDIPEGRYPALQRIGQELVDVPYQQRFTYGIQTLLQF
jgi:TetR/AcrR family tetracycline transcriptional repressor